MYFTKGKGVNGKKKPGNNEGTGGVQMGIQVKTFPGSTAGELEGEGQVAGAYAGAGLVLDADVPVTEESKQNATLKDLGFPTDDLILNFTVSPVESLGVGVNAFHEKTNTEVYFENEN